MNHEYMHVQLERIPLTVYIKTNLTKLNLSDTCNGKQTVNFS